MYEVKLVRVRARDVPLQTCCCCGLFSPSCRSDEKKSTNFEWRNEADANDGGKE